MSLHVWLYALVHPSVFVCFEVSVCLFPAVLLDVLSKHAGPSLSITNERLWPLGMHGQAQEIDQMDITMVTCKSTEISYLSYLN